MYKIYADGTLIYDSTDETYKIVKGNGTLETNKSGSFSFAIYPDHFYYDSFVRKKTIITVYKSGKIIFRGRILNDTTDHWNNKVLTCEGELGYLLDSVIRPFEFNGTPEALFNKFVTEHNAQVDEFKRFKIGKVTVIDPNNYIARSNTAYESAFNNINSRLLGDSTGGYLYITHGEDGKDPMPTLNYLADFTKVSTQKVEFGSNLKQYTKTVRADDLATAIIPLGYTIRTEANEETGTEASEEKLTIASVNGGIDYVYDPDAVALYGWIFKVVEWSDVTDANNLKRKAEEYLDGAINQNITIELNAIDLHMLDKSIESFNVCDYIHVISEPHNFDSVLLCNKQTFDLLKPENDSIVLGYTYATFTESTSKINTTISNMSQIQSVVNTFTNKVVALDGTVTNAGATADELLNNYNEVSTELGTMSGDMEIIAGAVTENARNIATNAQNIAINSQSIADILARLESAGI